MCILVTISNTKKGVVNSGVFSESTKNITLTPQ